MVVRPICCSATSRRGVFATTGCGSIVLVCPMAAVGQCAAGSWKCRDVGMVVCGIVVWSDCVGGVVAFLVVVSLRVVRLAVLSLCCGVFGGVTWSGVGDGPAPGNFVCV